MKIGFIGAGRIAQAVITGLCNAKTPLTEIKVSDPRKNVTAELADKFELVTAASNNQHLLDEADIVVLAVRPQDMEDAVRPLRFQPDTKVISFVLGIEVATLRDYVQPAMSVVRVVPLPPVAFGVCAVATHPKDQLVEDLFNQIGTVSTFDNEEHLQCALAVTAMMAPFFGLERECANWMTARGIARHTAEEYVTAMFHGLVVEGANSPFENLDAIVKEAQTPGGINEEALVRLTEAGWYQEAAQTLDAIYARLASS